MRAVSWHPFLSVRFEDDAGAPVTGLSVAPLPGTDDRIARHGLTFRAWPDRMALYSRRYDGRPDPLKGPIARRTRFAFALDPRTADFGRLYGPDLAAATGPVIYLNNLTPAGAIRASGVKLHGGALSAEHAVALAGATASVTLDVSGGAPDAVEARSLPGDALIDRIEVPRVAGATTATVTLTLDTDAPHHRAVSDPAGAVDRGLYADPDSLARAPRGILELYWETRQDAVPSPDGVLYRVVFPRR